MSTSDVPEANPANGDDLHVGCWAEHNDGSLMMVQGAENGIVYSIFDVSRDPPIEYRDSMVEKEFKKAFTKKGWIWHDKTAFPWDRVMRVFKSGQLHVSAADQLSAAQVLAERRSLRGLQIQQDDISHKTDQPVTPIQQDIIGRVQNSIDAAFEAWNKGR